MEFKLSKPLTVGEVKHEALKLDLDALTGADVLYCEREAAAVQGQQVRGVLVLDAGFQIQLAARASGLDVALLSKLPAPDFVGLLTAVQGFLLSAG